MNKAERLFQLVTLLRGRRTALTATEIADLMQVSQRTVYRDVQALIASGIPIEGEAGVGYLLRPGSHLPALMFEPDEVLALLVGSRMVQAFTDPQLAQAARQAELRIRAILPDTLKQRAEQQPYRIPVMPQDDALRAVHGLLRGACDNRHKVSALYTDEQERQTERIIWPLGLIGWSGRWTLLAWCELRQSYRHFRFDRFANLQVLASTFSTSATCSLAHYFESELQMRDPG